jgi:hypothetical protein
MTSNNPKTGQKTRNQYETKRLFKLISTISGDGRSKDHLGETLHIEWNSLTPRSTFFVG